MALTNLILTVAGVSAVILLMRSDVKQSASIFKRNVSQIRHWLEQESSTAAKYAFSLCLFLVSKYAFVGLVYVNMNTRCQGTHNAWANRVNAKDEKKEKSDIEIA